MFHLKHKKRFAVALLALMISCFLMPFASLAADVDLEDNENAVAYINEATSFSSVSEDEQAHFATAASAYIDNYSDNVKDDKNFDANLSKSLEAKRSSVPVFSSIWSLLPPIIAIVLALITKEVYSS